MIYIDYHHINHRRKIGSNCVWWMDGWCSSFLPIQHLDSSWTHSDLSACISVSNQSISWCRERWKRREEQGCRDCSQWKRLLLANTWRLHGSTWIGDTMQRATAAASTPEMRLMAVFKEWCLRFTLTLTVLSANRYLYSNKELIQTHVDFFSRILGRKLKW